MDEKIIELEVSEGHIKKMQMNGAFDAMNNDPMEFPDDKYYLEGYLSVKK